MDQERFTCIDIVELYCVLVADKNLDRRHVTINIGGGASDLSIILGLPSDQQHRTAAFPTVAVV